jgi:hypothetical protein
MPGREYGKPTQQPDPLEFTARAIGEHLLARLTELDHLRSDERRNDYFRGDVFVSRDADARRIEQLEQHIDVWAKLAEIAARAEHTDVLSQQMTNTRRRADDY